MRGWLRTAAAAALLAGCGGDPEPVAVVNRLTTPQQEAADLAEAHALGIISDAELAREQAEIGQ